MAEIAFKPDTQEAAAAVKPDSKEAKVAVNIFASIDVLGLLEDPDYPGATTIESAIKDYYNNITSIDADLRRYAMTQPLQKWDKEKERYLFSGAWNSVIEEAKGQFKTFSNTSATKELLNRYVRLIANRGDTQGWKLQVDGSDLTDTQPQYLTEAFNLSVKAKPGQWLRWWGNSITPFSALQCVIGKITNNDRPQGLSELQYQQDVSVAFNYPSANISDSSYTTASSVAFSRMGQLKLDVKKGEHISYDILFRLVDPQGDVLAAFQVDPEIIVI
jgi:hypothetical protein